MAPDGSYRVSLLPNHYPKSTPVFIDKQSRTGIVKRCVSVCARARVWAETN